MLKKDKRVCTIWILIMLIMLPVSKAESDFLLNEDFLSDKNWTAISGTWKAINGEYTQSSGVSPSLSFAGESNWNDYTSETKVKFNSMGGIGFVFRANNEKQYYVAYLSFTRETESLSLFKHTGPGLSDRGIVALAKTPLSLNKWYTLKVTVKGSSIKIYLDNILKIDKEDLAYSSGKIGLYSWGTDASFDDVRVYEGDLPPQPPPQPTATQKVAATSPVPSPTLQQVYQNGQPIYQKDIVKELPVSPYDYKVSLDYSLSNSNWNGASKIYQITKGKGYPTEIVESFRIAYNWRDSILVILYPDFGINPEELYNYVANGGNVLIADDFGYGNYVLSKFPVSFGYGEVRNEKYNYGGKNSLPTVNSFKKQLTGKPVTNVVTNHPTYLTSAIDQQDLAYFPEASYVDKNFNGVKDTDEPDESLVFAEAFEVGRGRIVVLSDPSVFTNGMLELGDNKAFYENSISWLSRGSIYQTVFFEKRLESISKRKLSKAQKQLNETESKLTEAETKCYAGDYGQCLDSTAKGEDGINNVRDSLYGKEGKERAKSEIEKALKEIENLKQEINDSKQNGINTAEAEQYLNAAKEKIENAVSRYSVGDYSNALKYAKEGEDAISKARDSLFGESSKSRAKIELASAQKDLRKLKEELNGFKTDEKDIKKENGLLGLLNPLFTLQTWLLLFMALAALYLGEKYVPTVSSFFKRSGTTSRYLHSMEKATAFDMYNEPAIIMGQEFKEIFYKNIGAAHEMPIKEVVKLARTKYPNIKKRRLNKTLKTIQKIESKESNIYAAKFNGKEMEKLYSNIYAILNEIKEVETFENRKYRQQYA